MRLGIASLLVLVAACGAGAVGDSGNAKEQAVRLYDRGAYEEARAALHDLDTEGGLDGPLLYRLFFCEKATGHDDEAKKALARAKDRLESDETKSPSLEGTFYLANAYSNLGRSGDASRVAHDMTSKIEAGTIAAPTTAIAEFQLGKLYQDQSRQKEAMTAYARAVDEFDLSEGRYVGNVRWALRYLGTSAFSSAEFAKADSALTRLADLGGAEAKDWETLAAARARMGRYAPAADAWKSAVKLDQANADDARYSAKLAETAAAVAPLPVTAPGGAAFTAMSQSDLETFLKARAEDLATTRTRAAEAMRPDKEGGSARPLDPKLRAELTKTLLATRQQFLAAGLEYALRRYGIRETAFREGYAVIIFQDNAWDLPKDPGPRASAAPAGS